MRVRKMLSMCGALVIFGALVVWLPDKPASTTTMEIGNQPTIRSIALTQGSEPGTQVLATLTEDSNGQFGITVNEVGTSSGFAASKAVDGDPATSWTTTDLPAGDSAYDREPHVYISSPDFLIRRIRVVRDPGGRIELNGPTVIGTFGDSAIHGHPTALAVLPRRHDSTGPSFAIGTDLGNIILAKSGIIPCTIPAGGPVVSITVVPQVGHFAFVVLVNRRDGQHLVGVRPSSTGTCVGTPVVFDLMSDGMLEPDITFLTSGPLECDPLCQPILNPEPVNPLGTNGTRLIQRLTIPAEPTIGGTFSVRSLKAADSPIKQAAVGPSSLALLPIDGAGVLYDPGFRIDRGGVSGKILTILGSSVEVSPRRLSLQGRRQTVSIFIEVANGNAALIDRTSLNITIGGTSMANAMMSPQLPKDNDQDGNLDLEVKLNRDAVQSLIPTGATSVTIAASWRFTDGSVGRASAEIRIKSQGDDDDEDSD